MVGKWLGVLKEIAPSLSRVGFLVNPETSPHYANYFAVFTDAAPKFKVEPIRSFVGRASEIEDQIAALARQGGSGLLVANDTFTALHRELIAAIPARHRVPAVYVFREAVVDGGLISYGPDHIDVIRRSASYIDCILRGERPAELPNPTSGRPPDRSILTPRCLAVSSAAPALASKRTAMPPPTTAQLGQRTTFQRRWSTAFLQPRSDSRP